MLIGFFSKPVSHDNTIVEGTAFDNGDAAPSHVIVTILIRHIAEPMTQLSRGPPASVQPTISHRESRNAAYHIAKKHLAAEATRCPVSVPFGGTEECFLHVHHFCLKFSIAGRTTKSLHARFDNSCS
jgi:hypothetical protein